MQKITVTAWFCLLFLAQVAFAQSKPDNTEGTTLNCPSLTDVSKECQESFKAWHAGEQKWRAWVERYGNRSVPDNSGFGFRKRPQRPPVLEWLVPLCEPAFSYGYASGQMCLALDDYNRYDWTQHLPTPPVPPINKVAKGVGENTDMWTFLIQSMHFDFGWIPANTNGRFVLLGGVHLAVAQISERMYVFAPGVMVVRLPNGSGGYDYKPAQTWGLSVRLKDFEFPWSSRDFSLYFNLANCRIPGMDSPTTAALNADTSVTVMGLSFSLKK